MLAKANLKNAFLVVQGKSNIAGTIKECYCNGKPVEKLIGLTTNSDKVKIAQKKKTLDMVVSFQCRIEKEDGKTCSKEITIRVLRYCGRKNGDVGFMLTNLPMSVQTDIVLNLMRLRWQIENVFKNLKSHFEYRAFFTKFEGLTKALALFSVMSFARLKSVSNLLASCYGERLSLCRMKKLCLPASLFKDGNLNGSLVNAIAYTTFLILTSKITLSTVFNKIKQYGKSNLSYIKMSEQSNENEGKLYPSRIITIVQIAIDHCNFSEVKTKLNKALSSILHLT